MLTAKLRHPMKISGTLWPKGTVVERLSADHPLVQLVFPGIKANLGSGLIAVRFPNRTHATIALAKSFCAESK